MWSRLKTGTRPSTTTGGPSWRAVPSGAGRWLGRGARAAPHFIAAGHAEEEEQRRFAQEVATWLDGTRHNPGAGRVALFAPARFLGLLRPQITAQRAIATHEGELAHLRAQELAVHPAVVKAVTGR